MWNRIFGHRDVQGIKKLLDNYQDCRLKVKDCKQEMKFLCFSKIKLIQNAFPRRSEHRASIVYCILIFVDLHKIKLPDANLIS